MSLSKNTKAVNLFFLLLLYILTTSFTQRPMRPSTEMIVELEGQNIDILDQSLKIELENYGTAKYTVSYIFLSNTETDSLTLFFDRELSHFELHLDNKSVDAVKCEVDSFYNIQESYVYNSDFSFYKLPVEAGKHRLDINYYVESIVINRANIYQYEFIYKLQPICYKMKVDSISVEIDAKAMKMPTFSIISDSSFQINGETNIRKIDRFSEDSIVISITPQPPLGLYIDPSIIAILVFVVLLILNIQWLRKWRKTHVWDKFSVPTIVGAFLIPAIALFIYSIQDIYNPLINGPNVSMFNGYMIIIVVFLYPILVTSSFTILWIIDSLYKLSLRKKDTK